MQNEIRSPLSLLDDRGRITREGWARRPYWRYDRRAIRAAPLRVKEWDYYAVLSDEGRFGIAFTMSDLDYAGMFALCFLDFERGYCCQVDALSAFTRGRTALPPDSEAGRSSYAGKKLSLDFSREGGERILAFRAPGMRDAWGNEVLEGRIVLGQDPAMESMCIASSWAENRRAFYYNRKINCMPAAGGFSIGAKHYDFRPERDSGVLDWGRGNWTYKNRWYWSSASGWAPDGKRFGWNLGYGFSDRSSASENCLFHDGKVHKLEDVAFEIDTADYMRPWRFTSSDGRFEAVFRPIVDRRSSTELLIIRSAQHQVFGRFEGRAVLDDGRAVEFKDFLGFAEDVLNHW